METRNVKPATFTPPVQIPRRTIRSISVFCCLFLLLVLRLARLAVIAKGRVAFTQGSGDTLGGK